LVHTWIIIFPFVGHQSTILGNRPSPSISCDAHVSLYQVPMHLSMQQVAQNPVKKWQTMMWCFYITVALIFEILLAIDNIHFTYTKER
jgi:hypothetical protein